MKIVFVSNYFNHHQKPFSDEMSQMEGIEYYFIATSTISPMRISLGYTQIETSYVRYSYLSEDAYKECVDLIINADIAIYGSAPLEMILPRLRQEKLTFRYSERIFKKKYPKYRLPLARIRNYLSYGRYKNQYLLCASAYAAEDYAQIGCFKNKAYKWGYFPEVKHYDIDQLFEKKNSKSKVRILWVGRLIQWKHPEISIDIARRLKDDGYQFELFIIGNGELEEDLNNTVKSESLEDYVFFMGSMSQTEVRTQMEQADIFLFTSDFNEGWGAVLNESMNSGCAVIASHAIGSVPFLIEDGRNGFIYKNNDIDDLYDKVELLTQDKPLKDSIGKAAYNTIHTLWSPREAADRFYLLCNNLLSKNTSISYKQGPLSVADRMKNDWI